MPDRRHSAQGRLAGAALWLSAGFALALMIPAVLPNAVGYESFVVRSGSMEPSISRGDVLVSDPVSADRAKEGDVITFRDPESDELITHRVRRTSALDGEVLFVTKGDANTGVERWRVPAEAEVPRLSYRIPKLGYATLTAEDPHRRLILIGLAMVAAGAVLMHRRRRMAETSRSASAC
jgi:signal peptidase